MNDTPTLLMRTATICGLLTIVFSLWAINATLGRIADHLPVAEEVRTSE